MWKDFKNILSGGAEVAINFVKVYCVDVLCPSVLLFIILWIILWIRP